MLHREKEGAAAQSSAHRKQQEYRVQESHIAGQNLLKLHLRPPSRRGCFDEGQTLQALAKKAVCSMAR